MTIKILSLNLWHGTLIEKAVDFIKDQDADIVLLQEVHNGIDPVLPAALRSFELIKKRLQYPADDFAPTILFNHPEGKIPNGIAIFSKFPILAKDLTFFDYPFDDNYIDIPENYPKYPHALQHAVLETPIGSLDVFNFHGAWDLDGDNYSERRRNMAQIIIKAVKGKKYVVLGGDTNAKHTNQAMRDIERHLTSVFGDELITTFNMRRKDNPGYAAAAVDMLFVSPHIEIVSKQCLDVDISDHLPIMAELRFA